MGGRAEADLTEELRALPWRAAVRHVVDLLRAAADPALPFMLAISRQVVVDPSGPVTYASPMAVYRVPDGLQDMHDHDDDTETTSAEPS
ncbi:hypothetical protein [Kitasatospora mediocidica]|nr:hypothetical protein [Kitasatospora mediocidica]